MGGVGEVAGFLNRLACREQLSNRHRLVLKVETGQSSNHSLEKYS